jgi:hypothetical protein
MKDCYWCAKPLPRKGRRLAGGREKLWVHDGKCFESASFRDGAKLYFITAIWPVPKAGSGFSTPKTSLLPINLKVRTFDMKTGKEVQNASPGQAFMLPPRQEFPDGSKVFLSPTSGVWCSQKSEDIGFRTRKKAESHALVVTAAKPYWIGKLTVERL